MLTKYIKKLIPLLTVVLIFSLPIKSISALEYTVNGKKVIDPWLSKSPSLWGKILPDIKTDKKIKIPENLIEKENIGVKINVDDVYDRWTIKKNYLNGPFITYGEITSQCKGLIETDFALTKSDSENNTKRKTYFRAVNSIINITVEKVLNDFENNLSKNEKKEFKRAFKATLWQESLWQHYLRYKDWFFVLISTGGFNRLGNWGISQIARARYKTGEPLAVNFFDSKGYCKISSTIYYGAMIFFYNFLEARKNPCNGKDLFNQLTGAHNAYASGHSTYYKDLSKDRKDIHDFQIFAMKGFRENYKNQPWKSKF